MLEAQARSLKFNYMPSSPINIESERRGMQEYKDWEPEHYYQLYLVQEELLVAKMEYLKLKEINKNLVERNNEYMDQRDEGFRRANDAERKLEDFKRDADKERQKLIRKLHTCEENYTKLAEENGELERQIRDLQDSGEDEDMKAELEHYKKLLAEAEQQKDEIKQKFDMFKASFDVCAANNEVYEEENQELKKENEALQQLKKEAEEAIESNKRVSHMFHIVMTKNAAIRKVLKCEIERQSNYRRKLNEPEIDDVEAYMDRQINNILNPIPLDDC